MPLIQSLAREPEEHEACRRLDCNGVRDFRDLLTKDDLSAICRQLDVPYHVSHV